MTDWFPTAERIEGAHQGGLLVDGPPRVTWHFTADRLNPRPSFDAVCAYLVRANFEPHLMWDPESGRFAQFMPASRSAYAVRNLAGGVETNRYGSPHIQIEVYFTPGYQGRATFTDGPLVGRDVLMAWLDELGIPRVSAGDFINPSRAVDAWMTNAGHFGHSMVPENDHTDPGPIDIDALLAPAPPVPREDDMQNCLIYRTGPAAGPFRFYLHNVQSGLTYELDSASVAQWFIDTYGVKLVWVAESTVANALGAARF